MDADPRIQAARRRPTVAMEVRRQLREMIADGRLMPGQALSENEVAARLGLSRTPVREAFIKLEEEGLIAVYPQYGSFVTPIRVADIYDGQFVRESLECAGLLHLVERLGDADAAAIKALLATQKRLLSGEPMAFFEADELFHATLLRLAGHPRAWSVVESAKNQHDRVRRLSVRDAHKRRQILAEHADIVDHVVRRDGAGAVAAMQRHLRQVFTYIEIAMKLHPDFFAAETAPPPKRGRAGAMAAGV